MNRNLRVLCAAVLMAGLLAGCRGDEASDPADQPPLPAAQPASETTDLPALVARVEPSVVTVLVGEGLGSGVVFRSGGLVLTNRHVVGGARTVQLALASGERTPAAVAATDPVTDLAVLRAGRRDLPPVCGRATSSPVSTGRPPTRSSSSSARCAASTPDRSSP